MKPIHRQARALDDFKQEGNKPDLTVVATSSSTVNEPNTDSRDIKQEDTKNESSLLKQGEEFGEEDYYYQCDRCMKRMPNLKLVLQHRKLIHNVKRTGPSKIKDIDTEPDIHDPNFHCKSCNIDYNSRRKYRHHLKYVHFMALKTISPHQIPQSSIVPDPDDPNLYCRACDSKYSCKSNYKQHCRYAHGMTSVKIATTGANSDVDWRLNQQKSKDITPDINDPNFYCCACEIKLATKETFRIHLMGVHAIYRTAPKKTSLEPDINDPNNNCRTCQKSYSLRSKYRTHLRLVHQIVLPPLIGSADPGKLPDPNDPQNYCNVYHHSISNRNAMIDINHPEFYCAQCERSYSFSICFLIACRI
ncbi:hypothetical protein G6F42_002203 [Rhizopus arrhizus]|nr:hypothetical protein G6F42_002203 [Rhizopus arrhizus]